VREYPEPTLEPGAVLLQTLASEVCGTDVHLWHGRLAGVPYPLIPGHISVGQVAKTNGQVTDIEGAPIQTGDVVTFLDVHGTCFRCWQCLVARQPTRCPYRRVYGITYGADDGLLGGWSEFIHLKPGVQIVRLRAGVTPDLWIAGGCGLPTALHAVDRAEIRLGEAVVVQGAGPVGLSACALARASGAGWVGVVDTSEPRLFAAARMGADSVFWAKTASRLFSPRSGSTRAGGAQTSRLKRAARPSPCRRGCRCAATAGATLLWASIPTTGR